MPSAGSLSAARAFSVPPYIRYPAASLFPCLSAKKGSSLPRFHARKPPFPIGAPNFCGDLPRTVFLSPRLSTFRTRKITCLARLLCLPAAKAAQCKHCELATLSSFSAAKAVLYKTRKFLRHLLPLLRQKPPFAKHRGFAVSDPCRVGKFPL